MSLEPWVAEVWKDRQQVQRVFWRPCAEEERETERSRVEDFGNLRLGDAGMRFSELRETIL